MRQINKDKVPAFYTDYIRKNNPEEWNDILEIRETLRNHILNNEQSSLCAYTETRISGSGGNDCHIDHFRKQDLFPELRFEYNNFLVSCNSEKYGGKYKDKMVKTRNEYNLIIDPVKDSPSDYIEFTFTGKVNAFDNNGKGLHTIDVFNLNEKSLVERRKTLIMCLIQVKGENFSPEELAGCFGEFETMIRTLYDNV